MLDLLLMTFAGTIFTATNWINMLAFGMMIFAPNNKFTRKLMFLVPLLHALVYTVIIGNMLLAGGFSLSAFASLEGVRGLFSSNVSVLVGWIHYAAFDLFVGAWILENSKRSGIKHIYVAPILALTMMFGPAGLFAYFLLNTFKNRSMKWE